MRRSPSDVSWLHPLSEFSIEQMSGDSQTFPRQGRVAPNRFVTLAITV